jgi:predicted cupin superfamily sugar epimerase
MHPDAQGLIDQLGLKPHPEGGYYRELYRSAERITTSRGSTRYALSTITFLVTSMSFSAFHRLASDEAWTFLRGDPLTIEMIEPAGTAMKRRIALEGPWQTTVPAGTYFAAHVEGDEAYALVGCAMGPAWELADFALTSRAMLTAAYPQFAPLIARYTR